MILSILYATSACSATNNNCFLQSGISLYNFIAGMHVCCVFLIKLHCTVCMYVLEHAMKVIECVFERRIREKVKIDAMQFGFMPRKGTTDAIFTIRQMKEKYGCK